MQTQPQLMSRSKAKTFEFGYMFADDLATVYLDAEREGGRYYYVHAAHLASDGWSERRDSRTVGAKGTATMTPEWRPAVSRGHA